jgi:hypothetical protein
MQKILNIFLKFLAQLAAERAFFLLNPAFGTETLHSVSHVNILPSNTNG